MNRDKIGILLIAAGALLALAQFTDIGFNGIAWPLFIIVPGLLAMVLSTSKNYGKWLSILGAMVLTTGLILAYQSVFNHYESWAYAWTLINPGALGAGLVVHGKRFDVQSQISTGIKMMSGSALMFIFGAAFFEIALNISGKSNIQNSLGDYTLPIILVGFGLFVLMVQSKKLDK